jgi:hypothetical protein
MISIIDIIVGYWTAMGPKEALEESVPERDHRGMISTNVALVAVMRTREQSEMVVDGIPRLVRRRKCCVK